MLSLLVWGSLDFVLDISDLHSNAMLGLYVVSHKSDIPLIVKGFPFHKFLLTNPDFMIE